MLALSDRTWPVPRRPWVMRMRWSELLFAHWPVEPERVSRLLPTGLSVDARDGQAWVGVVPFLMSRVGLRGCPPFPRLHRFLELNVRTYVTLDDKPGVWFFSLDAASPLAVRIARARFYLPYMDAVMSMEPEPSGAVRYRSERTHQGEPAAAFEASYRREGSEFRAALGTLEHWLTARYCLYSADRKGNLYRGEIDHPPWTLSRASCAVKTNTMGEPLGFDLSGAPHLMFAAPIDVRAWLVTPCWKAERQMPARAGG